MEVKVLASEVIVGVNKQYHHIGKIGSYYYTLCDLYPGNELMIIDIVRYDTLAFGTHACPYCNEIYYHYKNAREPQRQAIGNLMLCIHRGGRPEDAFDAASTRIGSNLLDPLAQLVVQALHEAG